METTQNAQSQEVDVSSVYLPDHGREVSPEGQEKITRDIQEKGLIQEIVVAEMPDGRKELVAGQRRFKAVQALSWQKVRARVLPIGVSELDKALLTIAENEEREDVSPIDKALSYDRAMKVGQLSQDELAKRIGLDKSTTSQYLALARLPQELRQKFGRPNLGLAHMTEILRLPNPEDQVKLAEEASKEGLTSKEVRGRVNKLRNPAKEDVGAKGPQAPAGPFQFIWKGHALLIKGRLFNPQTEGLQTYCNELEDAYNRFMDEEKSRMAA